MNIGGLEIDIDVAEILDECNLQYKLKGNNYWLCCTAHSEDTPSLSIDKDRFIFNCFGCGYSGDIIKFLTDNHPEIKTPLQAHSYIYKKYPINDRKPLELDLDKPEEHFLDEKELLKYDFRHPYLYRRGFTEQVLQAFRVGYVAHEEFMLNDISMVIKNAITIPWRDRKGRLKFIQYRPLAEGRTKYIFRCGKEDKRKLLYGLHFVVRKQVKRVALVEGAFDCIWLWQNKIPAVAIGSAKISNEQVEQLALAGVKEVDLFLDNDTAGKKGIDYAVGKMRYFKLRNVIYPDTAKDANELSTEQLSNLTYEIVF